MNKGDIRIWVENAFKPLTLATAAQIDQEIDNGIRYWNTFSALKVVRMYPFPGGYSFGNPVPASNPQSRVQLDPDIKLVAEVMPASTTSWIWQDHPQWSLLGITILDNVTEDLIQMSHSFQNYRVYVGTDMRWKFEPSQDPAVGGHLYVIHTPVTSDKIAVVGARRIMPNEDVKSETILQWLLPYIKSLVTINEGRTLRKGKIIGIQNDGDELVKEGIEEKKNLEESLRLSARWVTVGKRF